MTQPLNIAIAKQTIRVGSNGIENRFTLRITKSEPGQKISQLSLESYGGYQGLIKDSLKFKSTDISGVVITAISDAEKSLSLNLIVAGEALEEPIFIELSLCCIEIIDVQNIKGFTLLPDFEKEAPVACDLVFEIAKKMILPDKPQSPKTETETQVIEIAEVQEKKFLLDIFLSNDGKRFRTSFLADEDLSAQAAKNRICDLLLKQGHLKVRPEHQILKYEGILISDDSIRLRSIPHFSENLPFQVFFTQPPTLQKETLIQPNQQKLINPIAAENPVQE